MSKEMYYKSEEEMVKQRIEQAWQQMSQQLLTADEELAWWINFFHPQNKYVIDKNAQVHKNIVVDVSVTEKRVLSYRYAAQAAKKYMTAQDEEGKPVLVSPQNKEKAGQFLIEANLFFHGKEGSLDDFSCIEFGKYEVEKKLKEKGIRIVEESEKEDVRIERRAETKKSINWKIFARSMALLVIGIAALAIGIFATCPPVLGGLLIVVGVCLMVKSAADAVEKYFFSKDKKAVSKDKRDFVVETAKPTSHSLSCANMFRRLGCLTLTEEKEVNFSINNDAPDSNPVTSCTVGDPSNSPAPQKQNMGFSNRL